MLVLGVRKFGTFWNQIWFPSADLMSWFLGHGRVELARFHTTCSLSNPVLISHKHACFITKTKWIRTFGITSGWVLQQKTDEAKLCITSWYVQCSKEAKNLARMRWWSFQRAPNNGQQKLYVHPLRLKYPLKNGGWKMNFPFGARHIVRGRFHLGIFREGMHNEQMAQI